MTCIINISIHINRYSTKI